MDSYMCDGSELKDAVYSYISEINGIAENLDLNYINSQIIPFNGNLQTYVRNLTPSAFANAGGNRANTVIPNMIDTILCHTGANDVSIFVSDCILDIPNGAAPDFLGITRTDIKNSVTLYLRNNPTGSIMIYQLESKCKGNYYPPKGGVCPIDTIRPYYMWIIGAKEKLAYIKNKIDNSKIQHGVKNYCAFTTSGDVYCEVSKSAKNKFEAEFKTKREGAYNVTLKVDFNSSLQTDDYITNVKNYNLINGTDINITSVNAIKAPSDVLSHVINLTIKPKSVPEYLKLNFCNLPGWVNQYNDNDGSSLEGHETQTFGLASLIGGVSDAYSAKNEYISGIKFKTTLK